MRIAPVCRLLIIPSGIKVIKNIYLMRSSRYLTLFSGFRLRLHKGAGGDHDRVI